MQLQSSGGAKAADSVPEGLSDVAGRLGHRPAISLLVPDGRQEQSFTSLAQWAAKTAHWLQVDHAADARLTVGVVGPPGWVPAVAALGAWWLGLRVVVGSAASSADVVVAGPGHDGTVAWGFGFDGSGDDDAEMFTWTVQEFPDNPPQPAGGPGSVAIVRGGAQWTQQELLTAWRDESGTVGVDGSDDWLTAAALRPVVTGRPTVLLAPGVARDAAAGDRVTTWL